MPTPDDLPFFYAMTLIALLGIFIDHIYKRILLRPLVSALTIISGIALSIAVASAIHISQSINSNAPFALWVATNFHIPIQLAINTIQATIFVTGLVIFNILRWHALNIWTAQSIVIGDITASDKDIKIDLSTRYTSFMEVKIFVDLHEIEFTKTWNKHKLANHATTPSKVELGSIKPSNIGGRNTHNIYKASISNKDQIEKISKSMEYEIIVTVIARPDGYSHICSKRRKYRPTDIKISNNTDTISPPGSPATL